MLNSVLAIDVKSNLSVSYFSNIGIKITNKVNTDRPENWLNHLQSTEYGYESIVESAIRPFVIGRKNVLFCDTAASAKFSTNHYSLIEIAKANCLEVMDRIVKNNCPSRTGLLQLCQINLGFSEFELAKTTRDELNLMM